MRKNDILSRVLKKLENVKAILSTLYLSKYTIGEQYLSINQLIAITKIPQSTIKGVLKNLVDSVWVEKRLFFPSPKGYPEPRDDYLTKISIRNRKHKVKEFWVPKTIEKEFTKRLMKLKKSKTTRRLDDTIIIEIKTYKEKLKELDRRKKIRVLKDHSLTFKGKTKLVNSLLKKWLDKKPIFFYRIIVFPFIIDNRVEGLTKLNTREMLSKRWYDVPKKYKSFWKDASNELKKKRKLLLK